MRQGPDITRIAALIGDPARGAILNALLSGKALTSGELAREAGVSAATGSGHMAQLLHAGLVRQRRQGRHVYYALADEDVAAALEGLAGLAAARGHLRTRTGPRDPALREARVCYDHLAGARGVQMFEGLARRGVLTVEADSVGVTGDGRRYLDGLGLDLAALAARRRPLCRVCLDWSERRSHLGGALGAALFDLVIGSGWARRVDGGREVSFSNSGTAAFLDLLG